LQVPPNYANHIALLATSKNWLAFIMAFMPTVASCHLVMNQQLQFIQLALRYVRQLNKL
jgi:hypothetical protein